MNNSPAIIGTYNITVPVLEQGQLLFSHGEDLGRDSITEDLLTAICQDRAKLLILIPEEIGALNAEGKSSIMAEFFIGLLERALIYVRDKYFKELKVQRNRSQMSMVGQDFGDINGIIDFVFKGSEIYAEFEEFIRQRILFGRLHADGSYTVLEVMEGRGISNDFGTREEEVQAWRFMDKYWKALDGMFMNNMTTKQNMQQAKSGGSHPVTPEV